MLKLRSRKAARTYTLKIAPKGLKAGNYTLRLRATRARQDDDAQAAGDADR